MNNNDMKNLLEYHVDGYILVYASNFSIELVGDTKYLVLQPNDLEDIGMGYKLDESSLHTLKTSMQDMITSKITKADSMNELYALMIHGFNNLNIPSNEKVREQVMKLENDDGILFTSPKFFTLRVEYKNQNGIFIVFYDPCGIAFSTVVIEDKLHEFFTFVDNVLEEPIMEEVL